MHSSGSEPGERVPDKLVVRGRQGTLTHATKGRTLNIGRQQIHQVTLRECDFIRMHLVGGGTKASDGQVVSSRGFVRLRMLARMLLQLFLRAKGFLTQGTDSRGEPGMSSSLVPLCMALG